MPWKATRPMDERIKFISHFLEGELSMAALCREYGISRKTGYKLVHRYLTDPVNSLSDRSRAPHHHPNAVTDEIVDAIVSARRLHPTWGPKKLRTWLQHGCPTSRKAGL